MRGDSGPLYQYSSGDRFQKICEGRCRRKRTQFRWVLSRRSLLLTSLRNFCWTSRPPFSGRRPDVLVTTQCPSSTLKTKISICLVSCLGMRDVEWSKHSGTYQRFGETQSQKSKHLTLSIRDWEPINLQISPDHGQVFVTKLTRRHSIFIFTSHSQVFEDVVKFLRTVGL